VKKGIILFNMERCMRGTIVNKRGGQDGKPTLPQYEEKMVLD
jgi:hypothetical protein